LPIARSMSSERSYTGTISAPAGRPGAISAILALTLAITSSAFWPKRAMAMPEATSPSPLSSAMPRRSAGTSSTRATSRTSTGVPRSAFTTRSSMSATPRR
jgi:hypothetical protein